MNRWFDVLISSGRFPPNTSRIHSCSALVSVLHHNSVRQLNYLFRSTNQQPMQTTPIVDLTKSTNSIEKSRESKQTQPTRRKYESLKREIDKAKHWRLCMSVPINLYRGFSWNKCVVHQPRHCHLHVHHLVVVIRQNQRSTMQRNQLRIPNSFHFFLFLFPSSHSVYNLISVVEKRKKNTKRKR